jgi:molecular chaperone DnaJ
MKKNYYDILGLTDEERKLQGEDFKKVLKKKWRAASIKFHPDRNPGNKEAEEKFKEAAEAYSVLSDKTKRAEYDNPTSSFNYSGPDFGGMNMDDILRQFGFGSDGNARGGFDPFGGFDDFFGGGRHTQRVAKGNNIRIHLSVSYEDVLNGCHKKIRYKAMIPCEECGGKGSEGEPQYERCPHCGGTGQMFRQQGHMQIITTCPHCGGQGKTLKNPCKKCGGHGIYQGLKEVEIDIPKGVSEGMQLIVEGQGNAPEHNEGVNGDLIIEIRENNKDTKFTRDENNLNFDLNISVVDAILGCEKKFNTIDGKTISAKIPNGVSDGQTIRFRGYGLPHYDNPNNRGDMIGIVKINIPKKINKEEEELLLKLKESENFK